MNADRRSYTRRGRLDVQVWGGPAGVRAELLDGSLSAIGATEDEAVENLALAVDAGTETASPQTVQRD